MMHPSSPTFEDLLALDETYRQTVLLHYFEELNSAEIARRENTPAGTVPRPVVGVASTAFAGVRVPSPRVESGAVGLQSVV